MEMFLIRLIYLKGISNIETTYINDNKFNGDNTDKILENRNIDNQKSDEDLFDTKNKTIGQIKNYCSLFSNNCNTFMRERTHTTMKMHFNIIFKLKKC